MEKKNKSEDRTVSFLIKWREWWEKNKGKIGKEK